MSICSPHIHVAAADHIADPALEADFHARVSEVEELVASAREDTTARGAVN
jgi:hypothetical protein